MRRIQTAFLVFALLAGPALGCTAFLLDSGEGLYFGRNYDWSVDDGLVLVNKRNMTRAAGPDSDDARWVSRFGSVTFNQFGRNSPLGGINERGLVIATLWLNETEHRPVDSLPEVGSLGWVQYQLDNCSTVAQVIASDRLVRISSGPGSTVHYFVADADGDAVTVEFLRGKPVYHHGENLHRPVITNSTCAESQSSLDDLAPFGGEERVPTDFSSIARYARTCLYLDRFDPAGPVPPRDYSFSMLSGVSQGLRTMWSIVYDIPGRTVWFRTRRDQDIRYVELERLDFSGATACMMLDVNSPLSGDVTGSFREYTTEANRDLIYRVFRNISFLEDIPDEALDAMARAPDSDRYVGE